MTQFLGVKGAKFVVTQFIASLTCHGRRESCRIPHAYSAKRIHTIDLEAPNLVGGECIMVGAVS